MSDSTIRMFRDGRFSNIPLPDWFERAIQISSSETLDWHHALKRALDAEHQGLTVDSTGPIGLEISFWHSQQHGVYVEIDSGLELIEQVLVRDPADWLPFMSAHLTPLLAAASQAATAAQLERVANALISFGRHEHGDHINRSTGLSRIDEKRDQEYWARVRAQARK